MKKFHLLFLVGCMLLTGLSCEKDKVTTVDPTTLKVNTFIHDVMDEIYLWADHMPAIDHTRESDPVAYFEKLLYTAEDKWSYITDDVEGLMGSLTGNEVTFGYSLAFGQFKGTNNYFAVVQYVYPHTPADDIGLKRGDIIVKINNNDLTIDNYTDLIYATNATITMGTLTKNDAGQYVIGQGGNLSLTARKENLNPVVLRRIFYNGSHRIGYLLYTQYIDKYNGAFDQALQWFKDAGVNDVVIDLRYNPGGDFMAAKHVCSMLAPADVVNQEKLLITKKWNSSYQDHWESNGPEAQLQETFDNTVNRKIELSRVYFITGRGTASASEFTISGLDPYMDVVLIGETTVGKYVASSVFQPMIDYDNGTLDPDIKNWAIQPIIYSYANANGVTDFKGGFVPDYPAVDDVFDPTPLGDPQEALLAKALEVITGIAPVRAKAAAARPLPAYTIIDQRTSRFDHVKGNLIETTPKR